MNLDISEHLAYNQYKEKLNDIFTKLDEVLYLSNTIDYKKITILLAEIVQNFDYFKHHKEKLAAEAAEEAKAAEEMVVAEVAEVAEETGEVVLAKADTVATTGGKRGRRKIKGGVEETPEIPVAIPVATPVAIPVATEKIEAIPVAIPVATPVATEKIEAPYSKIDEGFTESIKNIKEGEEYKRLVSYIDTTKERINNKGTKLMEKVKDFIKEYLQNPERNSMIDADYIKQHSNLEFKLNDIISNIDKIEDGIQKERTEYAKIYVDLMSNKWCSIKDAKYLSFITICADGWYYIKKKFAQNAHVIDKEVSIDITKDDYKDFEDKLYKLYLKLHKEFLKEPEDKSPNDEKPSDTKTTPKEDFDTIIELFKIEFESIKEIIAKDEEVEEANTDADAKTEIKEAIAETAKEGEETKAIAETAKTETTDTKETKETKAEADAKDEEEEEADAKNAKSEIKEANEAKTETKETKTDAETKADADAPKENKATTVVKAEVQAEEAQANVENIKAQAQANVENVKAEAQAKVEEVRAKAAESALKAKEKLMKIEEEAKVAEITKQANDARDLVLQSRATASSLFSNKNPFKGLTTSLQGLKEEVGTEANQTMDVYANAMKAVGQSVGQSKIDSAHNKINKINKLPP